MRRRLLFPIWLVCYAASILFSEAEERLSEIMEAE